MKISDVDPDLRYERCEALEGTNEKGFECFVMIEYFMKVEIFR